MHSRDVLRPWVSFCLATYRRPARLRTLLGCIAAQNFGDFEVIVSDNDAEQSSRDTVEGMNDGRFRYFYNSVNLGMVKNFNVALSHAAGEYVVMITDDDPIYPFMLSTLRNLANDYPGYGAYYGACDVSLESAEVAETYATNVGVKSFLGSAKQGTVRLYSPVEFLPAFFKRRIFPYMLWSTGIVRRDIAEKVGGMPEYGSPFLTDFTYMALAGAECGFATVNTSLGFQSVHGQNSGFTHPHSLLTALSGSHKMLTERLSCRSDWRHVRTLMERYLASYVIGHVIAMRRHFARKGDSQQGQFNSTIRKELFRVKYVRDLRWRYYAIVTMNSLPFVRRIYVLIKRFRLCSFSDFRTKC